jgi:DNA/RNA-binding domain of Phe-tRNA-synthetase-like protein
VAPIALDPELAARGVVACLSWLSAEVEVGPAPAALGIALEAAAAERAGTEPAALDAVVATRAAYRALGKDPSRYRPSAEALLRRLGQGKGLFRVNNVVDTNNLVSLRTGFSIGSYDRSRLDGPLALRRGRAGESYAGIGRGLLNLEGLPVLADRLGPFGSPTSDSERSMIGPGTAALLMVVYGFGGPAGLAEAAALAELCLAEFCAARAIEHGLIGA